jgi:hypothetical protein
MVSEMPLIRDCINDSLKDGVVSIFVDLMLDPIYEEARSGDRVKVCLQTS